MRRLPLLLLPLLAAACSSTSDDEERQLASFQRNALLYFEAGKFGQALGLVERGLEIEPDDYKLLSIRACVHLRQSGPASGSDHRALDLAMTEFAEVFDQRDADRHERYFLFYYALAHQKQGLRRMAEAARVDRTKPDHVELAEAKNKEADTEFAAARELLQVLLDRGEIARLCHYHMVQIAAVQGDGKSLVEHGEAFLKAAADDQKKTEAEIDRTTVYLYEQFNKDALKQLRGDEIGVRNLLAQNLYEQGDFEGSLKHVDAILAIDPTRSDEHYNRGIVLQKLGRKDESKDELRTFLATTRLPPDSPKVQDAVQALTR